MKKIDLKTTGKAIPVFRILMVVAFVLVLIAGSAPANALDINFNPPSISLSGTTGNAGWYTSPVTATINAGPLFQYLNDMWYRLDDSAWTKYNGQFTVNDGIHGLEAGFRYPHIISLFPYRWEYRWWSTDSETIMVDTIAPVTTCAPDSSIWYRDVCFMLSATESGSGIATTEYSFDGLNWNTYSDTPVALPEGIIDVYYRSIDVAGNVESAHMVTYKVDKTAPTVNAAITCGALNANGWSNADITVTITALDCSGSGVASKAYSLNGGCTWISTAGVVTFTAEGVYTLTPKATDNVGNERTGTPLTFKIDKHAPATTCTLCGTDGFGGWFISPVDVTLEALDYGEGSAAENFEVALIKACEDYSGVDNIEYSWDGSNWITYGPGSFTVTENGMHTLYYRSVDNACNIEQYQAMDINIDTALPFVTGTDPVANYLYAKYNASIYIYFSEAMDAASFDAGSIKVLDWHGMDVPGVVTVTGSTVVFDPDNDFGPNYEYTVTVSGEVMDAHGNKMGADCVWKFKAEGIPQNPWHYRNTQDQSGLMQAVTPSPTTEPTVAPTVEPTVTPTPTPTVEPTATPTPEPTGDNTPLYLGILILFLGIVAVVGATLYFRVFRK